ncbi:hypothetical protein [Thiosulfatihalobacter marinus]|uniref:hypothetical protein n=1 Tax=Thiosulfatihalobacter marinus TaxID=2792481 RepID=UPI0018D6B0A6|nr:hypothetical protein [Thiosulfatihalobacter marinus]
MPPNLEEIQFNFRRAKEALDKMTQAQTGQDLRDAWEDFLIFYARTMGKLISAGKNASESKPWAYRLLAKSVKDDPGLFYLREARNVAEHGLTPFADFREPHVNVGGILVAECPVENVTIFPNGVNSKLDRSGALTLSASGGKVTNTNKPKSPLIKEVPASLNLKSVTNEDNGKTADVPKSLNGVHLKDDAPRTLAQAGIEAMEGFIAEYQGHF